MPFTRLLYRTPEVDLETQNQQDQVSKSRARRSRERCQIEEGKYLGVVFENKIFCNKQIQIALSKVFGAYPQLKSFFDIRKVSVITRVRAFTAGVKNQLTYNRPMWRSVPETRFKQIKVIDVLSF